MGIFNIDFENLKENVLPPNYRTVVHSKWLQAFMDVMQYLRNKILGDYRTGSYYSTWSAGTYNIHDRVMFEQVVYESLEDGNTDQPPSSKWAVWLPSFIGADERKYFNGQKVVLEYALNRYYGTTFRQPPLVSDIYIDNLGSSIVGFVVGIDEAYCSTVAQTDVNGLTDWNFLTTYALGDVVKYNGRVYLSLANANTGNLLPVSNFTSPSTWWWITDTVGYVKPFARINNFVINVPTALFYSPSPNTPNLEPSIRTFLTNIVPSGLKYIILPY